MLCSNESHPPLAVKNADAECHIAISLLLAGCARSVCSACNYTYNRYLRGVTSRPLNEERPEARIDELIFKDAPDLLQHERLHLPDILEDLFSTALATYLAFDFDVFQQTSDLGSLHRPRVLALCVCLKTVEAGLAAD